MEADGGQAEPRYRVRLIVDGVERPLKPFLHNMLGGAAFGLVEALKDVDAPTQVVIEAQRVD